MVAGKGYRKTKRMGKAPGLPVSATLFSLS